MSNDYRICSLHHKLLDYGAFTVNTYGIIEVSEKAYGNTGFDVWLGRYHHEPIQKPARTAQEPAPEYFHWHRKQVFKGLPRD